jgi:hypothetical protein
VQNPARRRSQRLAVNVWVGMKVLLFNLTYFSRVAMSLCRISRTIRQSTRSTGASGQQNPRGVAKEIRIAVLYDRGALLQIDEPHSVFSSKPGVPVKEFTLTLAPPALMIRDEVVIDEDVRTMVPSLVSMI